MILRTLLLSLVLAVAARTQDAAAGPASFTIRAEKVYVGDGTVIAPAVVRVEKGKIVAVGPAGPDAGSDAAFSIENAFITPGFVEGSTTVGLPRGLAENEEGSEVTPCVRASSVLDPSDEGIRRLRDVGVTSLVVSPGNRNVIGGLAVAVKPGRDGEHPRVVRDEVSLHAVMSQEPAFRNQSPRGGAQSIYARRPNSRMGVVYELRRAFQEGCERNEGSPMGKSCFCEKDGELLGKVTRGDVPVSFTAHAEQEILAAINIADEFGVKGFYLEGAVEAYLVRDLLARRRIPVLTGALYHSAQVADSGGGRARRGQGAAAQGYQMTDRGGILGAPKMLKDAGVAFGLSEGSWESGGTLLDFAQGAARAGLAAGDAIAAISGWPAAIVGLRNAGVVAPGRDADLNVFSGDPLSPASRLLVVIIDGVVCFRAPASAPESRRT